MLDPKKLRTHLRTIAKQLEKRGVKLDIKQFESLDAQRKELQQKSESLKAQRNAVAKSIGTAKSSGKAVDDLMKESQQINEQLNGFEQELAQIQQTLDTILTAIPNPTHESVPAGTTDEDNIEIRRVGEPKTFKFTPKDHTDLGENLQQMDFKAAAKIAGTRFVVLYNGLATLHRALIRFMIDIHTKEHGYEEIYVPYLVNYESMFGSGQFPKFDNKPFAIQGDQTFYLIPTAEVPVTNLARDTIFKADELPKRWVCHSPSFRSESGSYGKDVRGMLRQHQFEKVELVQFIPPWNDSYQVLEELTEHAENILKRLELPYRVVLKCAGDTSFSATKSYDLEVWLPGQNRYREISSCSLCEDFQARRMHARVRNPNTNKPELIHTLNGSGLAVGRTLIAVMENYQNEGGEIEIPHALLPYMDGQTKIATISN
jgi:seryl-tRNA synthetase